MPEAVIIVFCILLGIGVFISFLQMVTEKQYLLYGLLLSICAVLFVGCIFWANIDCNFTMEITETYQLHKADNRITFIENGETKNATQIFGINDIDPTTCVVVKYAPISRWSYGRYMHINVPTTYSIIKTNVE